MLDWRQLYDHLMRATPDRPIFGEISTQNAFAALAVLNAGMTGFMCSIHADSPEQAINRKFDQNIRSEEHTSELQSLMRISYAVFCLKKKTKNAIIHTHTQ